MPYLKIQLLILSCLLFTLACQKQDITDIPTTTTTDDVELVVFSFKTAGGDVVDISCDNNLSKEVLSSLILEQLATTYEGYSIFKIKACIDEAGNPYFQIKLKKDKNKRIVLYYDAEGNLLDIVTKEDEKEETISLEDLPQIVLDYLNEHHPDYFIIKAEKEEEGFEIKLEDGTKLTFDLAGNLMEIKTATEYGNNHLAFDDLPASILDYITANYPDHKIVKAEKEADSFEVKLTRSVELIFDVDGNFIGVKEKDKEGEKDDQIKAEDIPQTILDYIAANYPESDIVKAEKETDGFEIKLSEGVELIFDTDGNFIKAETEEEDKINVEDLPQAIIDYITENYPNHKIVKAEQEADKYLIKLNANIKLLFDLEGNFLGEG